MVCTTTMPPMAGFGTLPNNTMSESEYCAALIDYYLKLGIFITDLEARSMWIQATAEAACTAKDEAQTSATNAANSATTATNAAAAAEISKDEAQAIVDTVSTVLPPGTLVDGLISNTTTWSSDKISKMFKQSNLKSYYYGGA